MWLVGLALALGLPSLLSPYVSLVMIASFCVICLAGRINPAIIGLGLVFCCQLARVLTLAHQVWEPGSQLVVNHPIQLISVQQRQGQAYGIAKFVSGPLSGRFQLSWSWARWQPQASEIWQAPLRLRAFDPGPAARDLSFHYLANQWVARARLGSGRLARLSNANLPTRIQNGWRDSLAQASQAGQWLGKGMLLGEKPDWGQVNQAALEQSGLGHLFSPSGLHLAMAVNLIALGAPRWGQWRGGLIRASPWATPAVAWVVWVLPLKLPIIRSFIAYLLWRGNRGAHRFDWSSLYLATLCLTLMIWPAAGGQSSTFLSFGAVGWILLVARTRVSGWRKTVSVLLGLSALGALMGLGGGLMSPISNGLWVPLLAAIGAPALVWGLVADSWWAWSLFADLLNAYLLWIPHYSLSQWQAAGLLAAAMVLLWPVLMPVALLALVTQLRTPTDGLWLYSVGAGQAMRIQWKGQSWLMDLGPARPGQIGAAGWELIPDLRREGIRTLTGVIAGHGDADHAGGLASVQARFPIQTLIAGEPDRTGGRGCHRGQRWSHKGLEIQILWGGPPLQKNAASCVIEVRVGEHRIWVLGDSPKTEQWAMARVHQPMPGLDLLVAAHHGARDGFSHSLASIQRPAHVVFSQAKSGRWAHPAPEIEQAWQNLGSKTYRLGESGTLFVDLSQADLVPKARFTASPWTRLAGKISGTNYAKDVVFGEGP